MVLWFTNTSGLVMFYKQPFHHCTYVLTLITIISESLTKLVIFQPETVMFLNAPLGRLSPEVPLLTFTFLFFMASFLQS